MALAMRATRIVSCPRQRMTLLLAPPVRPITRIGASTSRGGVGSEPVKRDRVDTGEQLHRRAYDPRRQEKLEKYLSGWKSDVESTGPVWNAFTVVMATAAVVVFGLGLFAWLSYGILWGVQGGYY